jgi:hypothetical protein
MIMIFCISDFSIYLYNLSVSFLVEGGNDTFRRSESR